MSKTQEQLQALAHQASALGFQVSFGWTPQDRLGRSLRTITVSGYDDWDYQAGEKVGE